MEKIHEFGQRTILVTIHLVSTCLFSFIGDGFFAWFMSVAMGAVIYTHIVDTRLARIHVLLASCASGILFFCSQMIAGMQQPMLGIYSTINAVFFLFGAMLVHIGHVKEDSAFEARMERIRAEREERNRAFEETQKQKIQKTNKAA